MKLIATKTFSYNTRRLSPGDMFEAKDPDGRLLIGVLKARKIEDRAEQDIPAPKKELLNKLASGGNTDTKLPTHIVGEKPSEQTITIEQANELKSNLADGEQTEDKPAAKEVVSKDEPKATPAKESTKSEPKATPKSETVHTRGRPKN